MIPPRWHSEASRQKAGNTTNLLSAATDEKSRSSIGKAEAKVPLIAAAAFFGGSDRPAPVMPGQQRGLGAALADQAGDIGGRHPDAGGLTPVGLEDRL